MTTSVSRRVAPGASPHAATLGLLLATLAWGCSFTWAKTGGEGLNQAAGVAAGAVLGPLLLLAWRFTLAGVVWLCMFPAARQGWTWVSLRRAFLLGFLLWAGQTLQVLGLDRTSEAVSAFLTSLSVVFVPVLLWVVLRRPPARHVWIAVGLAALGVWLMTGAAPTGFGLGEGLGFGCAMAFSGHLILLGDVGQRDSSWRLTAGQFLSVGILSGLTCTLLPGMPQMWAPQVHWQLVVHSGVWQELGYLILLPTLGSFGLMFYFQPRLDPTRAALLYLAEPLFAALFAYVMQGRTLSPIALGGAVLLLTANVLAELVGQPPKAPVALS